MSKVRKPTKKSSLSPWSSG